MIVQEHRFINKRTRRTSTPIITEIEAMHMIKKNILIYGISLFKIKTNSFINYLD